MTGISAYGAYVPMMRLSLAAASGRPGAEGGPERAVAYDDEDAVTMGVAAAVDCLRGVPRESVDAVLFASTTYPFREKQGAALVAKALDLRREVRTTDHAGSLRAGSAALQAALDSVAAGSARRVLVVASDCRMGAPRGPLEAKLGDGAAAFLVSDDAPIATLEAAHTVSEELQDLWRSDGDRYTHTWEDRFVVQEGYARLLPEAVKGLFEKTEAGPADFARAVLYAPDARSGSALVGRLGLDPDRVQDLLFGRLGNAGVAFVPLLLAHAFETLRAGDRVLVAAYGDGAEALSLRVTEHLEKLPPRRGVSWHLTRRRSLRGYDSYLRSRGLTPTEWEPGTDPGLSATIHYRERDADIGLVGRRCTSCGLVHFPGPRVCYGCHAVDRFEPHRLSDRTGRVLAYTFDYFFPAAEPPTTVIMSEVDGCRLQVQLADAAPDEVRLGLPVEFVFRKIHEAGGKPNYFWKASPLAEEALRG